MMRTVSFGFLLLTALSVKIVAFVCYAFVDDADLVHTVNDVHTRRDMIMIEMQDVVDHWKEA